MQMKKPLKFDDAERSAKELKRIEKLKKRGKRICLNKKGHLCFRQMHPDFSIYVSAVSVIISAIAMIVTLLVKLH